MRNEFFTSSNLNCTMNAEMIDKLLKSNEITKYILVLTVIFNYIDSIIANCDYMFIFIDNYNVEVSSLDLFASEYKISQFLEYINDIVYEPYINSYPEFQYINLMISKLKSILVELSSLEKKTESLLIQTINGTNISIAMQYINFLTDISQSDTPVDIDFYNNLENNVLTNILNLKKMSDDANDMFNFIRYSLNLYLTYFEFNTPIEELKYSINCIIKILDSILEKHWIAYLKINKIPIFLQLLLEDTDIKIINSLLKNDIYTYNKLNGNIIILTLLIQYYVEYEVSYSLSIVIDFLNIQLFLSSIINHIDIYVNFI